MSLEKVTCSYFGPVADQVVTDTGQFDRFEVISLAPLHHGLERSNEIEIRLRWWLPVSCSIAGKKTQRSTQRMFEAILISV
jgi:hypothetical protein